LNEPKEAESLTKISRKREELFTETNESGLMMDVTHLTVTKSAKSGSDHEVRFSQSFKENMSQQKLRVPNNKDELRQSSKINAS